MTSRPVAWQLREATPDDLEGVASAHLASWRSAYRGLVPHPILDALTEADFVARWRHDLETLDRGALWVAISPDERGDVLGFAFAGPARDEDLSPTTGEVYAIHLRPEHVGAGLGRVLLERAVEALRALDCTEAVLWVLEGNARARRFYEQAGWVPDGTSEDRPFESGGHSALVSEVRYSTGLEENAGLEV